ncbi:Transcriptional Coactivator p15 (PC4) [Caballeronia pedi]|uniref:Transcriptional Coactivator p15 (PC4) n=1 Tax=Caballeronia pedi TaxID=1777141 RepID=A0A158DU89_9BURK|nr:transcriptional coactivator p15/PC4 family protein [Caballeronia pedi]SAK98124.1 Transcriptional Coactivator p15 (PC4) [Caballeronia pedi]
MTDKKMADPKASQNGSHAARNDSATDAQGVQFLDIQKSDSERLRVYVKEYRGRTYIDIRVWYLADGGEYRPSGKGITVRPALAAGLIQGIDLAARSFDPKEMS